MNNSTQTISRNAQIDAIWANSKRKDVTPVYSETLKELKEMSDEDILALFAQLPVEEESAEVNAEILTDSNITSHTTTKGETYFTIGLPLVEIKDQVSFRFQHGDAVVIVSSDMDLYRVNKATPLEIGDVFHFTYDGPNTFKKLDAKGEYLVANNSIEFPYRGMLSKSANPQFESILAKKAILAMERKITLMEIAEEEGISVRQVRQIAQEDLKLSVSEKLKARLQKK